MSNLAPLGTGFWGTFLSWIYRILLLLRDLRFIIKPPTQFSFPIISVGGISAGGTAKTPLTAEIIRYILDKGYTPVLISRGYGRVERSSQIVSADAPYSWQTVGDEPAMLKRRFPELWLAIGGNRVKTVKDLLPTLPLNAVGIMDDGFQHRALHRNLDIVTLPPVIDKDALIPAGKLREPLRALKRADIIVDLGSNQETIAPIIQQCLYITATPQATEWRKADESETCQSLSGTTLLFSGIARPERFHNSAQSLCDEVIATTSYPDHHSFSEKDYTDLLKFHPNQWGTTEKDLQRFDRNKTEIYKKLYYLVIKLALNDSAALHARIDKEIRRYYD